MKENRRIIYVCSNCGTEFLKWFGQCSNCGSWGTLTQITLEESKTKKISKNIVPEIIEFGKIKSIKYPRIEIGIEEIDRVLGGGIVPGSLILLAGEPGIGKSTLVLQIAENLSRKGPVLYVSGEESAEQIKLRLDRLNFEGKNLNFLNELDVEIISTAIEKYKPVLVIIDSIQTILYSILPSEPGSISQVKACTIKLLDVAKKNHIPIIIISHVTKEGVVAGPKTLEHLVDVVLYLEGERFYNLRLLRAVKNRFGTTNEVGVFDLQERGLIEVKNPSSLFLASHKLNLPGIVVGAILEGSRVFLVEIQALINQSSFNYPQRKAIGFDVNRLQLMIAILTQRCGLNLNNFDIYLNITGGLNIHEPAIDLPVCLAIISAFKNKPFDFETVACGEVGLAGEIRPVSNLEKRIKEAEKLGFKKIFIPKTEKKYQTKIKVIPVKSIINYEQFF